MPSTHSPERCRALLRLCSSRRMPTRSISFHDGTLSAKHPACTRRRRSWSKHSEIAARTASVA